MAVKIDDISKKVWQYLTKTAKMTPAGAAGMMGNLYAESGMIPNRVEILCLQRLREIGKYYTDATYTAFVDDGTISRASFLNPLSGKVYGYGLCQWTTPGRKAGLYDLCKRKKVSIGDLTAQLEYLLTELKTSYPSVHKILISASDTQAASDAVLTQFECPADAGYNVRMTRNGYAKEYYDAYAGTPSTDVSADDVIRIMQGWIGYSESNGRYRQIIDLYNSHQPLARGYSVQYWDAWCDTTVSAAFIKAGAVDLIGGTECGVEEHIKIFKRKGIWIEDGTIIPKAGDIICYNWDDATQPNDGYADHIGIVEATDGTLITVIEGNCDGAVKRRQIRAGWGYIRGYARPKYATKAKPVSKPAQKTEKPAEKPQTAAQTTPKALNKTEKWVGEVTADWLNVRSWAGTEYPNIKTWPVLAEGNYVSVCDTVKASDDTDWYYVYIAAGDCYGFVSGQYVRKV